MGLGPPVCENCELLADYYPNKEHPNKQGDWLCPMCGFDCNTNLFMYSNETQDHIRNDTDLFYQLNPKKTN